jgi:hypothetical protein
MTGIDGEELAAAGGGEHRAIVADAERRAGRHRAEPAPDGGDEFRFAEGGDGGGVAGERMNGLRRYRVTMKMMKSAVQLLNSAWATMAVPMRPVRS